MQNIRRGDMCFAGRQLVLILQSDPTVIVVPVRYRGHLLDQIRTIDRSRLGRYLCRLSTAKMNEVEQALNTCLGLYYEGRTTA